MYSEEMVNNYLNNTNKYSIKVNSMILTDYLILLTMVVN